MRNSRRDFIRSGLAVSGLAAISGPPLQGQNAASRQKQGLRLGTVTYNIAKDWDVETIIKNLSEVGMEAVELRTTHAHGVEINLPAEKRQQVRKRFEDSAVKIGGLGTTCEYHAADPAVVRKNIEETKEWIKLARDIGSPSVKVRPNGLPKDVPEEKTLEQIGRSLKECGVFAREHGIKVQLEVHGRDTARLPRIVKVLQYADQHPNVLVCWNSNQDDLLDGGLEANFNSVKASIGQVHMRDLFVEEYPFRRLIQMLSGMNFQGYCFAEIPASDDPVRVLKYFRGIFRAYQGII